ISAHAASQRQAQAVAPEPAMLGTEGLLAIKAAHGVATTDDDEIFGIQVVAGGLRMQRARPQQVLPAPTKRQAELGVKGIDDVAERGCVVRMSRRVGLATEPGHAATLCQAQVELRAADV